MSLSASFSTVTLLSLRGTRWCLRALLALVGLAWAILLLAWLVLHWAILPHIDEWRPKLEQQASKALGHSLHVTRITVGSGGWIPALTLQDVSLSDAQGRQALRLPEVKAVLSLESLLTLELRFSQLLIEAPELELRRDAQGQVFIAGMPVKSDPGSHQGSALADWFFVQHEFVIRHGRVHWTDEMRGAAPLALDDVDLVVRNGLRRHDLRLDATPPADWGQRFSLQGHFKQPLLLHRPSELRYWSGQLYGDLPRIEVRELQRYLNLPFELIEGNGALRTWVDIDKGLPKGMTLDMGLRAVTLRLAPTVQPLTLKQLSGRLQFQRAKQALQLSAQGLSFDLDPDLHWAPSDWSLALNLAETPTVPLPASAASGVTPFTAAFSLEGQQVQSVDLSASRLDLNGLARIATSLPLGEGAPALVESLAPRGQLSELSAHWEGPLGALRRYRVKGQLSQFAVNAQPSGAQADAMGRPGVQGANLSFDASETGGQAQMLLNDGVVDLPGLFEDPKVSLQRLSAELSWRIAPTPGDAPPAIEFKLAHVQLVNADVRGDLDLSWRTGPGSGTGRGGRYPGQLELNGRLAEANAASVARYLPLGVGAHVRTYVRDAVRSGTARNVSFSTKGDLWDFPFDQGSSGIFRISAQAVDVNLAYAPGKTATAESPAVASEWPAMEHLNAELIFDRASMRIQNGRTRVLGYELVGVNGGIKDLSHDPTLELEGSGRGPAAELLQFMRASPVGAWTGQALGAATGTGNANLHLALQLPLNDVNRSQVKGSVQLL
ncbi:MAG: AsmA family protein, partial [Paucibacter sp.]|nr:AsmA family protein [Roseateles sp.]